MHEVKVYDGSGNLKKVISVETLHVRTKKQMETPYLFRKNKNSGRPAAKSSKVKTKAGTPKP